MSRDSGERTVYCTACGIQLGADAKFCSSCGASMAGTTSVQVTMRDWDLHVKVLGWLVIAHAAFTAFIGLVVMAGGGVLQRFLMNNPQVFDNPGDAPPPEAIAALGPIAFLIGVGILLLSMPSIAAGVGLLHYRNWGRILTIVLSVLRILEFPFGTATAVYSFWVLLSEGGKAHYRQMAARAEA